VDKIRIKGARQHNLKNIDLEIPRNKLVVITGVSGSGKSSLAFDTLYAEGQRRYVESLSSYARQFLGVMEKPDVDLIEGLSPAISIEQKSTQKNPRSTVGTTTEIYDYLRLLFARIGKPHCPKCGKKVEPQTIDMIVENILQFQGAEVQILSPIIRQKKGTYQKLFEDLNKDGFSLVLVNGKQYFSSDSIELDKNKKHDIAAIIDQFKVSERRQIVDSIQTAMALSKGYVQVKFSLNKKKFDRLYTNHLACVDCEVFLSNFEPRDFSFNAPFGACENCTGLGEKFSFDEDLVVPNKSLSIADGAIKGLRPALGESFRIERVGSISKICGFSIFEPFCEIDKNIQNIILHGLNENNEKILLQRKKLTSKDLQFLQDYEGVVPMLERLYTQADRDYRKRDFENYMRSHICEECNGMRLKKTVLSVLIEDKNIFDLTKLNITSSLKFFENPKLSKTDFLISSQILKEIKSRLNFLENVGLGYLDLARRMETLSGGEAQRIRLATQIGSNLMGVMYVLDEPSIGLHQRDNAKLIGTLKRLRDLGNTVIVVEHDEDTILEADYVVDIGPGAGIHGGEVVACGTAKSIIKNPKSLTGKYLSGALKIEGSGFRREPKGFFEVIGAEENNLKNIDLKIPKGVFVCITGVSGSGKSTLINEVLAKNLAQQLHGAKDVAGKCRQIKHDFKNFINIDQMPIGRTPRSNPATYVKLFDEIRKLFAMTPESKSRGYKEGRFSFNVKGGRCEKCQGDGTICMEMHFLPDVHVKCEDCQGKRYNHDTLEILYKGKNIYQVLSMNVLQALEFFHSIPTLKRKLQTLADVGLGYIQLGQSATLLSGGEAQRVKLSRELSKVSMKETLYILDEPTTGLHFDDVKKLLTVLNRLVSKGASCVVIEHNLDVIKNADYIIDLGPEGGEGGGTIVAQGTPEDIIKNRESHTGKFLAEYLNR